MKSLRFLAFSMTVLAAPALWAQSAATVPEGYITLTIAAGTGTARTLSVLSAPLYDVANTAGQVSGRITGVTASTITNSNAGWTASQLSTAATPYLIKITSGTAAGRIFLISTATANTSTTVTIDSTEAAQTDLTTLSIATGTNGDTYQIIPADTISTLIGTPGTTGILANANPTSADNLQVLVGTSWRQYYHDGTNWRRIGPNTISNDVVIRPDAAVTYSRLGNTALTFTLLGRVPDTARKAVIANSGLTHLSNGFPVDLTLATSGINTLPGWVSNADPNVADLVQVLVGTAWRQYYHDGTNWRRVGPNTISDSQALVAGSAVTISKRGLASGVTVLTKALPYSL